MIGVHDIDPIISIFNCIFLYSTALGMDEWSSLTKRYGRFDQGIFVRHKSPTFGKNVALQYTIMLSV